MKSSRFYLKFEILFQLAILIFILKYFNPFQVFGHGPATGGDTGSHFWPALIMKEAWSNGHFDFRFWNPGNYYGEPLLIHYFPLPFMLMALLSYVIDISDAFNLVTFLGPLTLPLSVFWATKVLKLPHPYPSLTSLMTLFFLFDESWSIYGGNILSTLAGQFAHSISINLFIIAAAYLIRGMQKNEISLRSLIFFSLVCLSHAFTFLATPVLFLALLIQNYKHKKLKLLVIAGVSILLLNVWFIIPMIDNQKHNIAYAFVSSWGYIGKILKSYYLIIPSLVSLPFLIYFLSRKRQQSNLFIFFYSFFFLALFYFCMFFIFPHIGLPDGRAIPHVYLYLFICFGISISYYLHKLKNNLLIIGILLITTLFSIHHFSRMTPSWIKWNYSSWNKKPLSKDFNALTKFLKGKLSDPRIAYENSMITNSAGTIRAFEMLPYFSNRATTEGVYHQSTIVNNASFFLQSMISKTPSCPFHEKYPCGPISFNHISDKMDLLGVGQIILATNKAKSQAKKSEEVQFQANFGPWSVYRSKRNTSLSQIIRKPIQYTFGHWQKDFYQWFKDYNKSKYFLADRSFPTTLLRQHNSSLLSRSLCASKVELIYNGFKLKTNCPEKAHLLKFAYHSSWKTDDNTPIYKISPGFLLNFPQKKETTFHFAQKTLWKISDLVSFFSWILLFILASLKYYRRYEKH